MVRLTPREASIARLVAAGATNGEVAVQLGIAERTVKNRLEDVFRKLGVHNRVHLVLWFQRGAPPRTFLIFEF